MFYPALFSRVVGSIRRVKEEGKNMKVIKKEKKTNESNFVQLPDTNLTLMFISTISSTATDFRVRGHPILRHALAVRIT